MTPDDLMELARGLAASAATWRQSPGLDRSQAEAALVSQGLSAEEAKAVVEYGLNQRWLREEREGETTVLRPGVRAIFTR